MAATSVLAIRTGALVYVRTRSRENEKQATFANRARNTRGHRTRVGRQSEGKSLVRVSLSKRTRHAQKKVYTPRLSRRYGRMVL